MRPVTRAQIYLGVYIFMLIAAVVRWFILPYQVTGWLIGAAVAFLLFFIVNLREQTRRDTGAAR